MTFLEYVCERKLGKPIGCSGGRTNWPCPSCNHKSFGTLPPREGCKDRFRCHRCGAWGDEFDLLKELHPAKDFVWRRTQLELMRQDYEREHPVMSEQTGLSFSGDRGDTKRIDYEQLSDRQLKELIADQEFSDAADRAVEALLESMNGPAKLPAPINESIAIAGLFRWSTEVLETCARFGLHPTALADRLRYEAWTRESDAEHRRECNDPDCDVPLCREARGLQPLTREDFEAERKERQAEQEARRERIKRALKPSRNGKTK